MHSALYLKVSKDGATDHVKLSNTKNRREEKKRILPRCVRYRRNGNANSVCLLDRIDASFSSDHRKGERFLWFCNVSLHSSRVFWTFTTLATQYTDLSHIRDSHVSVLSSKKIRVFQTFTSIWAHLLQSISNFRRRKTILNVLIFQSWKIFEYLPKILEFLRKEKFYKESWNFY